MSLTWNCKYQKREREKEKPIVLSIKLFLLILLICTSNLFFVVSLVLIFFHRKKKLAAAADDDDDNEPGEKFLYVYDTCVHGARGYVCALQINGNNICFVRCRLLRTAC